MTVVSIGFVPSATAPGGIDPTTAGDFFSQPTCLTAVRTGPFNVTVTHNGAAPDNFSLPAQGIDDDVAPGQHITRKAQVGTGACLCRRHRACGTVGTIMPGSVEGR
ncbi:MAG: hypothetical protein NVS1B16_12620 [Pseudarthrobacter sp.]